jgi:hypothetical protein
MGVFGQEYQFLRFFDKVLYVLVKIFPLCILSKIPLGKKPYLVRPHLGDFKTWFSQS